MNVAKWLLSMLLALPFAELAAFIAVSAFIGFGWALVLILAGRQAGSSFCVMPVVIISSGFVSLWVTEISPHCR
ncbi:MAG: hypothetical protein WCB77_24380 [Pseudolabrys sp.]|jgi:hypothetical protein